MDAFAQVAPQTQRLHVVDRIGATERERLNMIDSKLRDLAAAGTGIAMLLEDCHPFVSAKRTGGTLSPTAAIVVPYGFVCGRTDRISVEPSPNTLRVTHATPRAIGLPLPELASGTEFGYSSHCDPPHRIAKGAGVLAPTPYSVLTDVPSITRIMDLAYQPPSLRCAEHQCTRIRYGTSNRGNRTLRIEVCSNWT